MASIQPGAFPRKLLWLVRYLGWYRALKICAVKPFDVLAKRFTDSEWFWRFSESQFDARYGVDTFEMVPVTDLGISDAQQEAAVFYEPTPVMEFGYIVSRIPVSHADYAFVDLGSGKGRALMLAAWFPFKRIVGIEISSKLHQIAEANLSRYQGPRRAGDIQSICDDAGTCSFPDEPMILFLFNPFHESVLKLFLENLYRSLKENPREVIILYGSPKQRQVFENTSWLVSAGTELGDWYLIFRSDPALLSGGSI